METKPQEQILPMNTQQPPNFSRANPLTKLAGLVDGFFFEAEPDRYLPETFEYLLPIHRSTSYGFSQNEATSTDDLLEPRILHDFQVMDSFLLRGWVKCGGHCIPFLQISYWAGPDSVLAQQAREASFHLGAVILLWIRVGAFATPELIPVPYDQRSRRFQIEIWGDPGPGLATLGETALHSLRSGTLHIRKDLLPYDPVTSVDPCANNLMAHDIEIAWADEHRLVWDSCGGTNHLLQFTCSTGSTNTGVLAAMNEDSTGGFGKVERRVIFQPHPQISPVGAQHLSAESLCISPGSALGLHRNPGCDAYYVVQDGRIRWATLNQANPQRTIQVGEAFSPQVIYHGSGNYLGLHNTTKEPVRLLRFRQELRDPQFIRPKD